MRLKRLELQGYKSFANRTEFIFDSGVTAIVGPNGSGKSNVADALRWVLGETNVRHLRGKKGEDLIFAGSDGRTRVGMAQVSLTLDNSTGWYRTHRPTRNGAHPADANGQPPSPRGRKVGAALVEVAPAEVVISRRIYRDGSNEFLINGQKARLADVQQLLAAGGIGGDAYVVVGQGLVDQALALKPEDRRALLDDAAGIRPLQAKRDRALARLDETRANLIRLNDILSELTPQLRRQERQAARAQDHQRLSAELDGLLVTWYGHQWHAAQAAVKVAEQALAEHRAVVAERQSRLDRATAHAATLRTDRDSRRAEVDRLRRDAGRLREAAESVRRELAVLEERSRHLTTRRDELASEVDTRTAAARELADRVAAAEVAAARAASEAEAAAKAQEHARAAADRARAERQQHAAAVEAARQAAYRAATTASDRRTRAAHLADRRAELDQAVLEAAEVQDEHQQASARARARLAEAEAALQAADKSLAAAESALSQARLVARDQAAQVEQAATALDQARDAQRQAQHQRAVLAELRRSALGSLVQSVLDNPSLTGIVGPLSHLMRVPTELESQTAAALGPLVHAIVVETWDDAHRAAAHLAAADRSPVTFFVRQVEPTGHHPTPSPDLDWLAAHVAAPEGLDSVVRAALADVALAPSLDAAHALLAAHGAARPCLRVVTPDGLVIGQNGALSFGHQTSAGLLSYEREWAALPDSETFTQAVTLAQTRLTEARAAADRARAAVAEVEGDLTRHRAARQEVRAAFAAAETALERAATAEAWHARQWQRQADEAARLTRQARDLAAEADRANRDQLEAEARLAELTANPPPDTGAAQTRLSEAQTAAAMAAQARQDTVRRLDQLRADRVRADRAAKESADRAASLTGEASAAERRLMQLRADLDRLTAERQTLRQVLDPAEAALTTLERDAQSLDREINALRDSLLAAERAQTVAQTDVNTAAERTRRLAADVEADLDLFPKVTSDVTYQLRLAFTGEVELPVVPELPRGLEERIRTLKSQLRRLGTPDHDALSEFAALQERHVFLTGQMSDLEAAAADLRAVITELDSAMAVQFHEMFGQVATRFSRNFSALFGGGSAKLSLIEGGGLDIIARPPGKRLQPLSLLSGGERALTACALLFALLEVGRAPFCLLDEVDAALDEANVGRFRAALERLAARTQVVLVTHNRGTVEAAQAIFGITMGGQGVSQAISIKLAEYERTHTASDAAD